MKGNLNIAAVAFLYKLHTFSATHADSDNRAGLVVDVVFIQIILVQETFLNKFH